MSASATPALVGAGDWTPSSVPPALAPGDAHVWRLRLDPTTDIVDRLEATLDDDERRRAARFVTSELRRRFVVGRGALRSLLGRYLAAAPQDVAIAEGPAGKPALRDLAADLAFNVSHSLDLCLLAFSRSGEIGVDIETLRPVADLEAIVARFFSKRERQAFGAVAVANREHAFFAGWTRKEAYVKARGEGLRIPLDAFDVALTPGEPARLLETRDAPAAIHRWRMIDLPLGKEAVGALVVPSTCDGVRLFGWKDELAPC